MLINDVESIVGLTKKSIRYYEEHNLIHPKRNDENGYREYNEEDIQRLKTIKFLRELGVSIKELEQLFNKEFSLHACMEDRMHKIEQEEKKYASVKRLCKTLLDSGSDIDNVDIDECFQRMNVLNKEGFTMRTIEEEHSKKIRASIYSALGFCSLFIVLGFVLLYAQLVEPIPWVLWIFIVVCIMFPVMVIPFVLKSRIDEIKKGEIDEASKY
ncbi:MAG: MerR family transcriptional regulator [Firmicutes bacterium]|nr:MerR family transcriptional regulator [Bacillota bacterium]